jgi:glutaredoxin
MEDVAVSDKPFKLYTISNCPHCEAFKKLLIALEDGLADKVEVINCDDPSMALDVLMKQVSCFPALLTKDDEILFLGVVPTIQELREVLKWSA